MRRTVRDLPLSAQAGGAFLACVGDMAKRPVHAAHQSKNGGSGPQQNQGTLVSDHFIAAIIRRVVLTG